MHMPGLFRGCTCNNSGNATSCAAFMCACCSAALAPCVGGMGAKRSCHLAICSRIQGCCLRRQLHVPCIVFCGLHFCPLASGDKRQGMATLHDGCWPTQRELKRQHALILSPGGHANPPKSTILTRAAGRPRRGRPRRYSRPNATPEHAGKGAQPPTPLRHTTSLGCWKGT